jgi:hypothetical protein
VLGRMQAEVFGFCEYVADRDEEIPNDKFLVIADENLDIVDGGARHLTVSGSRCVERESLDEATESHFCLIRSANDSAKDLGLQEQSSRLPCSKSSERTKPSRYQW